jgi:hypothetical protein
MRLADRNKFPPGGFRYYVPQTNWSITPWVSFDTAVSEIVAHRRANPYVASQNGWSLDTATVADELDSWNAAVCKQMGWNQFITSGGGPSPDPKTMSSRSLPQSVASAAGKLSAGIATIAEWRIDGVLVAQDLAETRAKTCSTCAKNGSGDLTSWFTVPAANIIKAELERRNDLKIHTTLDPMLGVCESCACPIRLKVHCPLEIINAKMSGDVRSALDPGCWILAESQSK